MITPTVGGSYVNGVWTPYTAPATTTPTPTTTLGTTPDSAYDILRKFFEGYGITFDAEIEGVIKNAMLAGYGPEQIEFIMPDLEKTQAFIKRFPGYSSRTSNGYNAINLGEYLQLENQYHRIMQEAGLPAGFYDDPSDFGNWIANNVSPDEIMNRVQKATSVAQQLDPTMRNLLAQFYGLTTGDIASYFLDQSRALPVIERQYKAAGVASWAARNGLAVTDMSRYENLADSGVSIEQAAAGYGTVKALSDSVGAAAGVYGETYDQGDAEQDVFFNKSDKRRSIMAKEAATFGGSSAGSTGSAKRQSY